MSQPSKVYLVRAGRVGEDEDYALDHGLAIIGFREIPSLVGRSDYDQVFKAVEEALPNAKPRAIGNLAGQIWTFAFGMQEGELVVLLRKRTSQVAIGRAAGPYRHREVEGVPRHTREVQWLKSDLPRTAFEQDLLHSLGAAMTVCRISRNDAERRIAAVLEGKSDPGSVPLVAKAQGRAMVPTDSQPEAAPDLAQLAHDQIVPTSSRGSPAMPWRRWLTPCCVQRAGSQSPRRRARTEVSMSLRAAGLWGWMRPACASR